METISKIEQSYQMPLHQSFRGFDSDDQTVGENIKSPLESYTPYSLSTDVTIQPAGQNTDSPKSSPQTKGKSRGRPKKEPAMDEFVASATKSKAAKEKKTKEKPPKATKS